MRRKRLKHAADTLCRMFCGWRLANSYRSLASLGSGTLSIDIRNGFCHFDGELVGPLAIAGELQRWLREDLAAHGTSLESLSHVTLTARLSFSAVPPGQRVTNEFYLRPDGKAVRSTEFYRCAIACESQIATDEAVYHSSHQEVAKWPEGWP